ncbi:MAG: Gfo/Idh/MocA family oxidoreductase [Melioribacteraceae bacterium]|nr:Gfo/Idh/MocA family oxidoreductase [Melioribacteraceae bacterium]
MNKLQIGVIGTGHLGNLHTKLLNEISNCEVVGVFDVDLPKAQKVGNDHHVSVFDKVESLLKKVDAVSIVASTSAHYGLVKSSFHHHKHVFVEKPITAEIKEAEELVKIARESKLKFQVGHIERFNPALISLEKYKLEPRFIQTDRLAQFNPRGIDVAVIHDLMIHDIDIILSLVKSDVKDIKASGVAVVSDNIDIANARLEFENGAVANVTASRISQKKMRKMRMFQRDTYISLDFTTGVSEVFRLVSPDDSNLEHFITFGEMGIGANKKAVVYEQPQQKDINALKYELQLFIDAVLEDKEPVVTGEDGLKALVVADAIKSKIEESQKS